MAPGAAVDGDARTNGIRAPYRLLWLIDSLTMGGAESLVVPFAREARSRGVDLTVCARTTIGGNPLETELREVGVRVENLEARNLRDVRALLKLSRLVRETTPDLIHGHLTYAAIWGSLVASRHGVPFVASLHVPPSGGGDRREAIRQRLLVWLLNRMAAKVVVVSRSLADEWQTRTSLRSEKLAVVHNGIELHHEDEPKQLRRELGIDDREMIVTTVAVLRREKGIDVLLRAIAQVIEEKPHTVFLVAGDGPMGVEWRRLAEELKISDHVRWLGFRRDVQSILGTTDLFVLPTRSDAFPTVLLEAFAAGVPVVASEVGGVPEIVEKARTGFLVPADDVGRLAETVVHALDDASWRKSAGIAAREKAEREFSVAAWYERLNEVYASAMGEARERK